jgi:hypothetical protein
MPGLKKDGGYKSDVNKLIAIGEMHDFQHRAEYHQHRTG